MPLFEYTCRACQARFELIVFPSTVPQCPHCESRELEKQLSAFRVGGHEAKAGAHAGCGGPEDCIGNRAAAARARGQAPCC